MLLFFAAVKHALSLRLQRCACSAELQALECAGHGWRGQFASNYLVVLIDRKMQLSPGSASGDLVFLGAIRLCRRPSDQ